MPEKNEGKQDKSKKAEQKKGEQKAKQEKRGLSVRLIKNLKQRLAGINLNRRRVYTVALLVLGLGLTLVYYNNYFNRTRDFSYDLDGGGEQVELELLPFDLVEEFSDSSSEMDDEFFLEDFTQFPEEIELPEIANRESSPAAAESDELEQVADRYEDVITEPLRPTMGSEPADIQLLKPLEGEVVQERGWYLHPIFNDWRYLSGINIAGEAGKIVMAADSGQVEEVIQDPYKGLLVVVNHEDVWKTRYGHLAEAAVSPGENVAKGQEIGRVGSSGMISEEMLYFELRNKQGTVDPGDSFE